jgi:hypothetical protein
LPPARTASLVSQANEIDEIVSLAK